jgi:HK97 gp10 family phage protein
MGADITFRLPNFNTIGGNIESLVLNALDECAGLVANAAKLGHPKVLAVSTAGTYRHMARSNVMTAADDLMRIANKDGSLRFLTRTKNLVNSILPKRAKKTSRGLESKVVSGMEYSTTVEFGTARTRPFPFMRPALYENRENILRRIRAAVNKGTEGK